MSDFRRWRGSFRPIKVDIVGDFAGKGIFAIQGEALLTHCLESARVDFDYGFQLLHAVHAVEALLSKLRDRGCAFHILWFEQQADICMPARAQADASFASKYRLARAVFIRHLSRPIKLGDSSPAILSYVFPDLWSRSFREYLDGHPLRFFLGSVANRQEAENLGDNTTLEMLYHIASAGICVSSIEDIEFKSSKVYLYIAAPAGQIRPLRERNSEPALPSAASLLMMAQLKKLRQLEIAQNLTARELISVCALSSALSSDLEGNSDMDTTSPKSQTAAVLLHLVALRHCELTQRSFSGRRPSGAMSTNTHFLTRFFDAAREVLAFLSDGSSMGSKWDIFDLFDGRLYINVSAWVFAGAASPPSLQISQELNHLVGILSVVGGMDISETLLCPPGQQIDETASSAADLPGTDRLPELAVSVLPFSHPIMDKYLESVRLRSDGAMSASSASDKIFQELAHWHNPRNLLDPKYIAKPRGFFAAKRHQKLMSDTIAYSASLTGALGKNIKPETITILGQTADGKKSAKAAHPARGQRGKEAAGEKKGPKSNKQKAIEGANDRRLAKQAVLSQSVVALWGERCAEFEKQASLLTRFAKAEKYFASLSSAHQQIIGSEVLLYLGDLLLQIQSSPKTPGSVAPAVIAMLWSIATESARFPLTKQVFIRLSRVEHALRIPIGRLTMSPSAAERPLCFQPFNMTRAKLLPGSLTPVEYLLEHCGPYLERSFDSAPDARVPSFHPDAWQRKVLDAIDADKSVLAVAPTSAGKTFISFYAMKKVLQNNDDDVLVYVAPNKALVNQVAAEVQARFSKSYGSLRGRSVWAIHTRDYRVNNFHGCQILVTVPSILQILLLSPSNAKRPQDFSRRIKRIIFDEVHCIGQTEEGIVWEQLLLLAPCPIIALSATIANPHEFKLWLARSQAVKGFDLELIMHSSRYSDLRKFIHDPSPVVSEFTGLAPVERLPFPGLDSVLAEGEGTPFVFIHPIGSLIDRNRDALNDTNLEPRDCLSLWKCMKKVETPQHTVPSSLDPNSALPAFVRKSDVVRWEAALKAQLAEWMADPRSPFDAVREYLRGQRYARLAASSSGTAAPDESEEGLKPQQDASKEAETWPRVSSRSGFSLVRDLRASGALPALLFNYERKHCEHLACQILAPLLAAEQMYRATNPGWIAKMAEFERWKEAQRNARTGRSRRAVVVEASADGGVRAELERDAASRDVSKWESFHPGAPLARFSLADTSKISDGELKEHIETLQADPARQWLIAALRRGIGVHHSGMNRKYRQVVEMLFRKGFLTVVTATGTLSMGINMPCKTVVFTGDSIYLNALNYRQASGRAGRRGFDMLGNVVFHNMRPHRALEIMSTQLPDLRGQFPTSVSLVLRLFILLHGTANSPFAASAAKSLLTQNWLYLGGPDAKMSTVHHLRFSIDYLRRQNLLSATGVPLNLSGLIGHLYYVESAAFAFHALLREGYFHRVCAAFSPDMDRAPWRDMALELVLTLSHLFVRASAPHRTAVLPALPPRAHDILARHNDEILDIYRGYVHSYVTQHLNDAPDDTLPLTQHKIEPRRVETVPPLALPCLAPVTIRSPFTALSGFTDADVRTIGELCDTVRAGVPLEASTVPSMPIEEAGGRGFNSYLLEFFKHGDKTALERDNGIRDADVWFHLKDFSLVLATIVTSLSEFLRPGHSSSSGGDGGGGYDEDGYDVYSHEVGFDEPESSNRKETRKDEIPADGEIKEKIMPKEVKTAVAVVADSWEDEEASSDSEAAGSEAGGRVDDTPAVTGSDYVDDQSLAKVYGAFQQVQNEFNEKFFRIWA